MKETEIEKLRQLVSRTDMRGNQKVDWLVNFINEREQALRIQDVVCLSEQLKAFVEKWNVENDLACSPVIYEGFVDEFLKSL